MASDGVDFVDEDNTGRVLLALFKQIANAAGTDAYKHFNEVGTGDGEEGNVGFTGDGAGQQSLTGARRSDEQDALRDAAAELLEFLRVLEELDDLLEFFFGFVGAGDVFKGHFLLLRGEQARAGLAEAESFVAAGLHLAHEEKAETDQQQERQGVQQNNQPVAAADFLYLDEDGFVAKLLGEIGSGFLEDGNVEFLVGLDVFALQLVAVGREVHGDLFDVALVDVS